MAILRWSEGPKKRGCVYHKRGTCRFGDDSIVVDVFVMPRISKARPIAITIGRYKNYKPAQPTEQWQLESPDRILGCNVGASVRLLRVGVPQILAAPLGRQVEDLLSREAENIRKVLASLSTRQPNKQMEPTRARR
jgi:hypothetical protein